jgi:hypothetical protein
MMHQTGSIAPDPLGDGTLSQSQLALIYHSLKINRQKETERENKEVGGTVENRTVAA